MSQISDDQFFKQEIEKNYTKVPIDLWFKPGTLFGPGSDKTYLFLKEDQNKYISLSESFLDEHFLIQKLSVPHTPTTLLVFLEAYWLNDTVRYIDNLVILEFISGNKKVFIPTHNQEQLLYNDPQTSTQLERALSKIYIISEP